ncbi:DNA polymerase III subunit delta' C-terminal domain-containing protein, partial [Bacillus altitudinis]|uniref:DNA polymerase III subunit delta' C-terminal domain-containing protein n=1 Tax=Bacillus altitudinis TaxID=293387 RepID=UPI001C92E9D0
STSIFSQPNFNTQHITPPHLPPFNPNIKQQHKTPLITAIPHQLQNEFAHHRQQPKKILHLIHHLLINLYKHQTNIQTHISPQPIHPLIQKIQKTLTFFHLKQHLQSPIHSIPI